MSWITENMCDFIADLVGGFVETYGELINNVFYWIVELALENQYLQNAQKALTAVSLALIALMVVKIVISGYLLETDYDPEADPFNLIVRIAETVAIISCSGWIFDYTLHTSKDFASDLIGSTTATGYAEQTQSLLSVETVVGGGTAVFSYFVMLLVVLVIFVIFTVVSGLRGGELIAMKLFLPVFALDLLTTSREKWNNFFVGYMFAFFSYSIQILFFTIGMKSYLSVTFGHMEYALSTAVWMILAIKGPKFLEKFLYQTGVKNAASSGIRMIIQTAAIKAV